MIVPAFENPDELERCLDSIRRGSSQPFELVVIDDASPSQSSRIAAVCAQHDARYSRNPSNLGPSAARNAGARLSNGEVLVFLDSDVQVHADTLARISGHLISQRDCDAVFGAYDSQPTAPGTVSRFRNLLHHYVHLQSAGHASTFWAGCGAMRREVFFACGGFDETYRRPSIEDVELGTRVYTAGHAIHLDPAVLVTHNKRWSLGGMFRTDLFQRAIPWTELAWARGGLPRGLNFGWANRLSVLLTGLTLVLALLRWPVPALASITCVLALNWPLYRYVTGILGVRALPASAVAHLAHFCAAFLGFLLGSLSFLRKRDPAAVPVAFGLLLLTAALQFFAGAYTADFSGHPDEPAHFVTSVMVTRYLDHPITNPMQFAQQYYAQYPKVGLGHWPPLGYLLHGVWMRIIGVGHVQALLLTLVFTALTAFLLYHLLRPDAGSILAILGASCWLLQDTVRTSAQQVMLDIPVVLFTLAALALFRGYVQSPQPVFALGFGTFAALALLIKANAAVLVFLPPAWLLVSGRWSILRRRDFWIAILPPLVLAGPWYAFSTWLFYRNFAAWAGLPLSWDAMLRVNLGVWVGMAGLPLMIAAGLALLVALWRRTPGDLLWAALVVAAGIATLILQAMAEPRHQLIALTAMIALCILALRTLPKPVACFAAVVLLVSNWHWRTAPHEGFTTAALDIARGPAGHVLLAGADDGALIAAAAALPSPSTAERLWLRANKVMGDVAWSGRVRSAAITTPDQVHALLNRFSVNQVFVGPDTPGSPFRGLLLESLQHNANWKTVATPVIGAALYRRRSPLPAQAVSFYLPRLGAWVGSAPDSSLPEGPPRQPLGSHSDPTQ